MQLGMRSQVKVSVDVLETEALYADCVADTLEVMRQAIVHAESDISRELSGTCVLLREIMSMHEDTLSEAARGKLPGPELKQERVPE